MHLNSIHLCGHKYPSLHVYAYVEGVLEHVSLEAEEHPK